MIFDIYRTLGLNVIFKNVILYFRSSGAKILRFVVFGGVPTTMEQSTENLDRKDIFPLP